MAHTDPPSRPLLTRAPLAFALVAGVWNVALGIWQHLAVVVVLGLLCIVVGSGIWWRARHHSFQTEDEAMEEE